MIYYRLLNYIYINLRNKKNREKLWCKFLENHGSEEDGASSRLKLANVHVHFQVHIIILYCIWVHSYRK